MLVQMRALLALVVVAAAACSTPSSSGATRALPLDFDASPPVAATVPKPQSPAEASVLIADAVDFLRRGDGASHAAALVRLEALLRCDFLTERGRANLYWLAADAARDVDDTRHREHLAAYIVAASVVPTDPEIRDRVRRARGTLLVDKVQSTGLGVSPERAIVVDSVTEADTLVAQLGCGPRRQSPYIERRGLVTAADHDDTVSPRRLLCTENGDELVLWFRIAD